MSAWRHAVSPASLRYPLAPVPLQTYLTRRFSHHFRAVKNRKVLLSATTGAAAKNLSRSASTVHDNFSIPVRGFMRHLAAHNPMRTVLRESSVYVIDEMSMLTTDVLRNVLNRLMQIHQCKSVAELLQKVSPTAPPACTRS